MPSEIMWCSKFFIWFLFPSCVLWASEFERMQVLILTTKKFSGHLSNKFSTAEIRIFIHCIFNSLTSKAISIRLNFNWISLLCRSILVRLEHASIASDLIHLLRMLLLNSKRSPFMWRSTGASVWNNFRNSSNMPAK